MKKEIAELREVISKLVPMLVGKKIRVTQEGSKAYVETDPVTKKPTRVNIPMVPDNAEPDFIAAVQGFIDHEVAHCLYTDWDEMFKAVGNPNAKNFNEKLASLANIMEDTMIERRILDVFPGARWNLEKLHNHFIEKITKPALKSVQGDLVKEFERLIVPMTRALAGHAAFEEFMDKEGYWKHPVVEAVMKMLGPQNIAKFKKIKSTKEAIELARSMEQILYPPQPPQQSDGDGDGEPDPKQKGKSQDKPDKKAGKGNGDGERDHSESEPGEEGEGDESDADSQPSDGKSGKGKSKKKDKSEKEEKEKDDKKSKGKKDKKKSDAEDGEDEGDGDGESDDDAGDESDGAGSDTSDGEEDEGDGDSGEGDEADEDEGDKKSKGKKGTEGEDSDEDGDDEGEDGDDEGEGAAGGGDDGDDNDGGRPDQKQKNAKLEAINNGGEADPGEDGDNSDTQGGGGGVGNGGVEKTVFDFADADFGQADLSKQISIKLSQMAKDALSNSDYNVFTREHDRIEPLPVPANMNQQWVVKMEEEVRSMTGKMQKDIERMMASMSQTVRVPGLRSGRLHAPSLHRLKVNDDRVFSKKTEHKSKETAITLLIDNSGSMGGAKCQLSMVAGYALASTLERVGMASEIIGFTTGSGAGYYSSHQAASSDGGNFHRITPIVMPIYKDFNERINSTVKSRIAYMANAQTGMAANIDGESLEYAALRLMKRREQRKVILVLSDGAPSGAANAGPHLKKVAADLNKMGIDCVGIGIMDASVRHYYDRSVVLNKAEELPALVMNELRQILQK